MIITLGYLFQTVLAWMFGLGVYQCVIALIGIAGGAIVESICIGFGPDVLRTKICGCEFVVRLIPTGGATKFADEDRPNRVAWKLLSLPVRAAVILGGPAVFLLFGSVLLAIPVIIGADGLTATNAAESQIRPCGVIGLALSAHPATWQSQRELVEVTAGRFFWRLATFKSPAGWGGPLAFFITSAVIAKQSFPAWLTMVGILFLAAGVVNLLPIPCFNGFSLVALAWEFVRGNEMPERVLVPLTYLGAVTILFYGLWLFLIDVVWLIGLLL